MPELSSDPAGYRVHPFDPSGGVTTADVLDLWEREDAIPREEAMRRIDEVVLAATAPTGELAGVSTAYLQRNQQLAMDLWYFRVFVARGHRRQLVSVSLWYETIATLEARFVNGDDRRASGIAAEQQTRNYTRLFNSHYGRPASDFVVIGHNRRGDIVGVHYFPGALVPLPS
jgi:hypothetical protein